MKVSHKYHLVAGIICLFTSLLHLFGGQLDLINPLFESPLLQQTKIELLGAWHMVSVLLFYASYLILVYALGKKFVDKRVIRVLSQLFFLFALVFIIISIYYLQLAPQWILLLPIALLLHKGLGTEAKEHLTASEAMEIP